MLLRQGVSPLTGLVFIFVRHPELTPEAIICRASGAFVPRGDFCHRMMRNSKKKGRHLQ